MTNTEAPEPQFFDHSGLRHAFYTWGTPDEHPPVVLQHGFSADTISNWLLPGIVQDLVDAGRWVVGLDARGHGRSDKPHDSAVYGNSLMAEDVSALISAMQHQHNVTVVDFAGYSMGGFIGMHVLPNEHRIRRAIISAVGVAAGAPTASSPGGVPTVNRSAIADAMERYAADPTINIDATFADNDARSFLRYARWTGADLLALAAHMRATHQPPANLDQITANVMVLAGRDDHLAKTAEELAAQIPGAVMVRSAGDHLSALAQPDYRAAFSAFLVDGLVPG